VPTRAKNKWNGSSTERRTREKFQGCPDGMGRNSKRRIQRDPFRVRGFKQTNEAYNYILIEVETFYFSIAKMILHVQGCARYGGTE
jgi:hypothetical protein